MVLEKVGFLKKNPSKCCPWSFIISPFKGMWPFFLKVINPLPNDACSKSGYNFLCPVALGKEKKNFVNIVLLFHYYLLFKKGEILLVEARETLYPLCLVLLKLWLRRMNIIKFFQCISALLLLSLVWKAHNSSVF